jgi:formylglycine-generating enzyme required for sulfatase activity
MMNKKFFCHFLIAMVCTHFPFILMAQPHATSNNMILIPAGEFIMGSDKVDTKRKAEEYGSGKPFYLDEHPEHKINLPAFWIDKFEVTMGEYGEFITATDYTPPLAWRNNGYMFSLQHVALQNAPEDILRKLAVSVLKIDMDTRSMSRVELLAAINAHYAKQKTLPVNYVSWKDADLYCKWRGKRLPTEQEWEKAARGTNGNEFVWGMQWQADLSNSGGENDWEFGTAPVGSFAKDKSVYGVMDMSGNVSEWVADWYDAYPDSDYQSDQFGKKFKVARGAGWSSMGHYTLQMYNRGAYRIPLEPKGGFNDVGFRCAKDAE